MAEPVTDAAVLVLPARLTHDDAPACVRMLQQGLGAQRGSVAIVDASALSTFDSSALAVLLECRREAGVQGRGFAVKGLPQRLRELAMLYGVAGLLPAAP